MRPSQAERCSIKHYAPLNLFTNALLNICYFLVGTRKNIGHPSMSVAQNERLCPTRCHDAIIIIRDTGPRQHGTDLNNPETGRGCTSGWLRFIQHTPSRHIMCHNPEITYTIKWPNI